MSKDIQLPLKNNPKAPFSLSSVELGFSILAGVATALALRSFIYSQDPLECGPRLVGCDDRQIWEMLGRPFFWKFVIPFMLAVGISSIFLLRSIRRDFRQFSMIANLAFAFPAFAFIGIPLNSNVTCGLSLLGLVLGMLAGLNSAISQGRERDWLSLAFNFVWIVIIILFVFEYLRLYD